MSFLHLHTKHTSKIWRLCVQGIKALSCFLTQWSDQMKKWISDVLEGKGVRALNTWLATYHGWGYAHVPQNMEKEWNALPECCCGEEGAAVEYSVNNKEYRIQKTQDAASVQNTEYETSGWRYAGISMNMEKQLWVSNCSLLLSIKLESTISSVCRDKNPFCPGYMWTYPLVQWNTCKKLDWRIYDVSCQVSSGADDKTNRGTFPSHCFYFKCSSRPHKMILKGVEIRRDLNLGVCFVSSGDLKNVIFLISAFQQSYWLSSSIFLCSLSPNNNSNASPRHRHPS